MKSIIALPNDYVVVDLETTGRNTRQDSITEIAAIRYRDGQEVETYHQMVKPEKPIRGFVIMLTGITPAMVEDAPTIDQIIGDFADFIGDDILIGHNIAAFDAVFIADAYEKHLSRKLENQCVDTMRIAKKVCPGLHSYSLYDLARHLGVSYMGAHRGTADCIITNDCYQKMRGMILENGTLDSFQDSFKKKSSMSKIEDITPSSTDMSPDHPLFGKKIVFTGALVLARADAMQLAVDFGAIPQNGVTTKTDFLVVGVQDIDRVGSDCLSSKQEKALRFNAEGKANIRIITEDDFISMTAK